MNRINILQKCCFFNFFLKVEITLDKITAMCLLQRLFKSEIFFGMETILISLRMSDGMDKVLITRVQIYLWLLFLIFGEKDNYPFSQTKLPKLRSIREIL
jgi:hypothetical protein